MLIEFAPVAGVPAPVQPDCRSRQFPLVFQRFRPAGWLFPAKVVGWLSYGLVFSSFWGLKVSLLGIWPFQQRASISRMLVANWSAALDSASMALSNTLSQKSNSWCWLFIWAQIDGRRPSRKHRISTSSLGAAAGSNSLSTACRCSRWAA